MNAPRHLLHKPIIAVNDYDKIDGIYASKSDAKALSIGQAQYDEDQISVKVFRHTGNKWSRQSEELPMHRALDLAILIIMGIFGDPVSTVVHSSLNEEIIDPDRWHEIKEYYNNNRKHLQPRLEEIKSLLDRVL